MNTNRLRVIALILLVCHNVQCASGQAGVPLLVPASAESTLSDPMADQPIVIRSRRVEVDFGTTDLLNPTDTGAVLPLPIAIELFDDAALTVVFETVTTRWPTSFSGFPVLPDGHVWHGSIVGDGGHVTMLRRLNDVALDIYSSKLGSFSVRATNGIGFARELDATLSSDCQTASIDEQSSDSVDEPPQQFGPESVTCDDGSIIDVLVVYTTNAKDYATCSGTTIEDEIELARLGANTVYANSDVDLTLRVVGMVELSYSGANPGFTILEELTDSDDGRIDEVHAIRHALGADAVCLLYGGSSASCPGYTDSGSSQLGNLMTQETLVWERFPFTTLDWLTAGAPLYVFTHELAHNMGCLHNPSWDCSAACPPECNKALFDYSFGHLFSHSGRNHKTILHKGSASTTPHLSNPDVLYPLGDPTGVPTGASLASACGTSNALTINTSRDTFAQFRRSANLTNTTALKSVTSSGSQAAQGASVSPSVSDSGRYVAFASAATNLFSGDNNGVSDVFVYDRVLNTLELKSGKVGGPANDASVQPVLSGDGRSIAFASDAKNLVVPNETTTFTDVYVRTDVASTQRLSVLTSNPSTGGNDSSFNPSISATGRFVVFESLASNLDENLADQNLVRDIFLRDRDKDEDGALDEAASGATETLRTVVSATVQTNGPSFNPSISADSVWIAFESDATNLISSGQDTNTKRDIFIRNRTTGQTIRASVGPSNLQSDGHSYNASISHDGRLVAFQSDATNLLGTGNDSNGKTDIFIHDRVAGTTICASRATGASGALGNGHSYDAYLASSGKYIAFTSEATNFESAQQQRGRRVCPRPQRPYNHAHER